MQFLEKFYEMAGVDAAEEAHKKYVGDFTKDAAFDMASKMVKGHKGSLLAFIIRCEEGCFPKWNPLGS